MFETAIVSHYAKFGGAFLVRKMFVKIFKREALEMIHLMQIKGSSFPHNLYMGQVC